MPPLLHVMLGACPALPEVRGIFDAHEKHGESGNERSAIERAVNGSCVHKAPGAKARKENPLSRELEERQARICIERRRNHGLELV